VPRRPVSEDRLSLVSIRDFKTRAAELLPPTHPLNLILSRTPDVLSAEEVLIRLDDWAALM